MLGSVVVGVPCIHRDKPGEFTPNENIDDVFPVYTGINRLFLKLARICGGVPCIHRDKPACTCYYQ